MSFGYPVCTDGKWQEGIMSSNSGHEISQISTRYLYAVGLFSVKLNELC